VRPLSDGLDICVQFQSTTRALATFAKPHLVPLMREIQFMAARTSKPSDSQNVGAPCADPSRDYCELRDGRSERHQIADIERNWNDCNEPADESNYRPPVISPQCFPLFCAGVHLDV
jgi:hypothetical protein